MRPFKDIDFLGVYSVLLVHQTVTSQKCFRSNEMSIDNIDRLLGFSALANMSLRLDMISASPATRDVTRVTTSFGLVLFPATSPSTSNTLDMQASSTSLQSTPPKPRSSRSNTTSSPSASRPQSELMELIGSELDDQTYEFDPDVVARMLSPKLPFKGAAYVPHPALTDFECLIDDPIVKNAMQQLLKPQKYTGWNSSETNNYLQMATFLNNCVKECDRVYEAIRQNLPQNSRFKVAERTKRWLPQLCFIKYDKETGDGIQNSRPLKPDIVGLIDSKAITQDPKTTFCWWNLSSAEFGQKEKDAFSRQDHQIVIAMEMKSKWQDMVVQLGTYARGLFAASPLRSFALVIAVNHKKEDLRFLIFHHGGLSASKAVKLDNAGCGALQKMLLSILLWQSAEDAGLPTFTNGQSFLLPKVETIDFGSAWNIKHVIHHSLSTRGRNTYVVSLDLAESDTEKSENAIRENRRYMTRAQLRRVASPAPHSTQTSSSRLQVSSGPGKHSSSNKKSPLSSNSPGATTDPPKRNADEAILNPILHREKRHRPLTAVKPSNIVASTEKISLPSTLVVKCSWPNAAKEEVEPKMYAACTNDFGTPQSLGSFVACTRENQPMCNSIFLPPAGEDISKYHWPVINTQANPTSNPKAVDCRTLWVTVLADEGQNLDECSDALDLCECLLHSMLGWLSVYQRGYLHRDISIGNLMKLAKPVSREPFNALGIFRLVAPSYEKPKKQDKTGSSNETVSEYQKLLTVAQDLDTALTQYELGTKFKAVVIDGDMATYIPDYFNSAHDSGVFSGTAEFMSSQLLHAMKLKRSCLHSPLDDLWSFFWTALWATLYNRHNRCNTDMENEWRRQLCDGRLSRQDVALYIKKDPTIAEEEEYSLILRQMAPLLRGWYTSLDELDSKWAVELKRKKNAKPDEMCMLFHKFAYDGVLDFVRIFVEHVQILKNASA